MCVCAGSQLSRVRFAGRHAMLLGFGSILRILARALCGVADWLLAGYGWAAMFTAWALGRLGVWASGRLGTRRGWITCGLWSGRSEPYP